MQLLYAIRFVIGDASFPIVLRRLQAWIAEYYAFESTAGEPVFGAVHAPTRESSEFPEPVAWKPTERDQVISRHRATSEGQLYELTWTHPSNSPGVDRLQRLEVALLQAEGSVEFDLQSTLESEAFQIAPLDSGVIQRPRIIDRLVGSYDCKIGTTPVLGYPQRLDASMIKSFVRSTLTQTDRALPVVLVSHSPETREPIRDPAWIQSRLLGLANVAELTPDASIKLTDQVGRARSCFDGRIRVYWPGFTRRSVPSAHPYFSPSSIREMKEGGRDVEYLLLEQISRVATERYSSSSALRAFRRHLRKVRRARLLQSAEGVSNEWLADYESVLDENQRLSERVEELEGRLELAQKNIKFIRQEIPRASPVSTEPACSVEEVSTPAEALEMAEEQFGQHIYVWKSAWKSAEKTQYHNPAEIVKALQIIADLAENYSQRDGAVGPWKKHFDQHGVKFAKHESESTMNQHGHERQFRDGGQKAVMESHVTLGQAHEHCIQIYFDQMKGDPRFHIGYVGEHLSIASDNT